MASKRDLNTAEKTSKKGKINHSLDDEKNQLNPPNNRGANTAAAAQTSQPKANAFTENLQKQTTTSPLSISDSNSNKSPKTPSAHTINRSFIKNSKLNIKMNASRPERPTTKLPFDNELVLQNLIRAQIEYLFSDYHLTNDTYLLARMQDNNQHWLSIDELCHNQKIRCLTNKKERILQALKDSKYLQLSANNDRVRRPHFTLPKLKPNRDLRRTVFLYGIAKTKHEQDIRKLLSHYGHIKRVHFQPLSPTAPGAVSPGTHMDLNTDDEAPNKCVAQLIMKKKFLFPSRYSQSDRESDDNESQSSYYTNTNNHNLYAHPIRNPNGDSQDFTHLTTCFVVFESQSQATKCVKARVRAVDGMRCIHKYDYNKVAKKYRTAQMKGEKLSFTPPPQNAHSHTHNTHAYTPGAVAQGYNANNARSSGCGSGGGSNSYQSQRYNNNHPRYNRSFGASNNYQSYRERSQSYQNLNQNQQQRYQRNNYKRAQTPNSKFYDAIGRKNRYSDDSDGDVRSHRLGRRGDRRSHDKELDNGQDQRGKYNNNNRNHNNSHMQSQGNNRRYKTKSISPQPQPRSRLRTGSSNAAATHSRGQSVGNISNNSDQKPIPYSMKGNNEKQSIINSNNSVPCISPQPIRCKNEGATQPQQPPQTQSQTPVAVQVPAAIAIPANHKSNSKNEHVVPGRAATPNMKSNGSIIAPPQLHTQLQLRDMYDNDVEALKKDLSSQAGPERITRSQSARQLAAAPTLYHPIPNQRDTAALQATQRDAAALQAAGYQHELYYLPMDDLAGIMDDPLIAYDLYFGVDQTGQPTATHQAAQQLAQNNKNYYQQTYHTQSQSQSQHNYSYQQQQYQGQGQGPGQQQHVQPHPSMQAQSQSQSQSYSAQRSYANAAPVNGPRSAPYGPVAAHTNQQLQFQAQQWQLDKLQQFKGAKAKQEGSNVTLQQNNKPATALSVLSSSN